MRIPALVLALAPIVPLASCEATKSAGKGIEPLDREHVPTAWEVIGTSVEGRPLRMRTAGWGPRRVLWVGGIHGNEPEGAVATARLPWRFLAERDLPWDVTLWVLEDVNPDGRVANNRYNANGVDLNRNYPARNFQPGPRYGDEPLSEPEAEALHDVIRSVQPELVVIAHSWGKKPSGPPCFVNWDGPGRREAIRFGKLSGYAVVPSTSIAGTPGSLGSWVGIDQQIPILTIEYERGKDPYLAWIETREAILAVVRGLEDDDVPMTGEATEAADG